MPRSLGVPLMHQRLAVAVGVSAVALLASCGSPRPIPGVATIATVSATASVTVGPPTPIDLSAVPAPEGLVLTIRFAHPVSSADRTKAFLDGIFPGTGTGANGAGGPFDLEGYVAEVADAPIGPALDLDAPVDVAYFGPGQGVDAFGAIVVSAAIRPGNEAMSVFAASFDILPGPDGLLRLRMRASKPAADPDPDPDDDDDAGPPPPRADDRQQHCVIAPAFGPAARRLVCAFGTSAVESLAPFMTRTLTHHAAGGPDIHAELHMSHELETLEGMAEAMAPKDDVDPETEKRVRELYAHFLEDLHSLAFDLAFDGPSVQLSVSLRFRSKQSQLTRLTLSGNDTAGPPPDAFFRLPADTSIALYSRGTDPKDMAPLRDMFFEAMQKELEEDGAPRKVIDTVMGALKATVFTGGPIVMGAGHDVGAARAALASYVAKGKDTIAARSAARSALQGWWLVGVEEPSARWSDAWKKMAAADAVKYTSKKKKKKTESKSDKETSTLVVVPLPAGSPLPKDTLHVEIRVVPKKGVVDPPLAHVSHFFIVPDGARTWLAMGEDVKLVTDHVRAAMSGAPDAGTIKGNAAVARLRAGTTTSGGFMTFAGLVAAMVDDTTDKDLKDARESLDTLVLLKSRGETPMTFVSSPDRGAPADGGGRTYELRLPQSAIADVAQHVSHKP